MVSSIIENTGFNDYFEMVPAVTDMLKNEVYKLRYQVYCTETGFLDYRNYADGLEYDEYDEMSAHYLVRHRKTGVYAATARLIMLNKGDDRLFPMELHSRIDNFELVRHIPRAKLAEVSRFCVSREFKRRKKEAGTLTGVSPEMHEIYTDHERRTFPHITIALIASIIKISDDHNIQYLCAVMEPALLRLLSTLGIHFIGIGPLINYHGLRQPCVIKVNDVLDGVAKKNPGLFGTMTDSGNLLAIYKQNYKPRND